MVVSAVRLARRCCSESMLDVHFSHVMILSPSDIQKRTTQTNHQMELITAALLVGVGILIVLALCSSSLGHNTEQRRPRDHLDDGRELAHSFADMGNLAGKTKDDFIAAVGLSRGDLIQFGRYFPEGATRTRFEGPVTKIVREPIIAVALCASLGACAQADWNNTVWAHAGIANPMSTQADQDAAAKQAQYLENLRSENAAEQAQRDAEAKRQADAAAPARLPHADPHICANLSGSLMHFTEEAAHGVPLGIAYQPYRDDPVTMDIITVAYRVQAGSMPPSQGIVEASKVCKRAGHHAKGANE
jgi:hypothetical protein